MLKAIIVDDEQHCTDRLRTLLQKSNGIIDLIGDFSTMEEAVVAIENLNPDVVFLDVHLHDKTGFDLLKQLEKVDFEVVFTTAYDSYAVEAFKFSAIDYLLKPVAMDDLQLAVEKLKKNASMKDVSRKIETLFHNLEDKTERRKKIAVPTLEGLTFINIEDIIRCRSDANYTHIYLIANKKLTVAKTLKYFENLLEPYDFFRTHQSHLINLAFIDKYAKGKGGYILMSDGAHVEVAVRRKEEFLKKLPM